MRPLGALAAADLALLSTLIGDHPVFKVYLAAGLKAERRGAGDRFALIGRERKGAALCVRFDGLDVRTAVGRLAADEEIALADTAQAAELHLEADAARRVASAVADRVGGREGLRYYRLDGRPDQAADGRCRLLGRADLAVVGSLFRAHYPAAIFSASMLDQPFLGLFNDGELLACGGVVAAAEQIANVGNFLTRPDARGRGLARAVAATLAHHLADQGMRVLTLGTTDENPAACRAYEAIGFRCFDRRVQLNLAAP